MSGFEITKKDNHIEIFREGLSHEELSRINGMIGIDLKTLTLHSSGDSEKFEGTTELSIGSVDVDGNEYTEPQQKESIVTISYDDDDVRGWMKKVLAGQGWCHVDTEISITLKKKAFKKIKQLHLINQLDYLSCTLDFKDWLDITIDDVGIYSASNGIIVEHDSEYGSQRGEVLISYGTKTQDLNLKN